MKPFNLQQALAGKSVVTRDGRPVKIAGYNPDGIPDKHQVVGWIVSKLCYWNVQGKCFDKPYIDYNDLFMAYEKKEGWINVYTGNFCSNVVYLSEEDAISNSGKTSYANRITTIKIEWEE